MSIIYSKFQNLEEEKQVTIINAALKEFAENGFNQGSTNTIVKEANISKGSLFNYFNNKKDLYIYLLDYSLAIIEKLYREIDLEEKDIFNRIGNFGLQKLEIQSTYPYVFDFLATAKLEEASKVRDIIDKEMDEVYQRGIEKIYQDYDSSKFRDDIDIEKAIEILNWSMFGFGEKIIHQIDSFKDNQEFGQTIFKEWGKYTEILKKSFYKSDNI